MNIESRAIYQTQISRLILGEDSLSFQKEPEGAEAPAVLLSVSFEDVIGLQVPPSPPTVAPSKPSHICRTELWIYRKKKHSAEACPRRLFKEVLEFSEFEDFHANHRAAMEWRDAIQLQRIRSSKSVFTNTPEQVDKFEPLRLLVIINPFSGKKNSVKLFRTIARPMFEVGGAIIVHELLTERQLHAKEFVESFDLSTITGIVIVSGDGIIYEVMNGLMARPDWETAIETPIGVIPTGSGNALVSSLLQEANEEFGVIENAVFQIINGGIKKHDIASVSSISSHSYICVLINWGMIGVIDIESERLRFLGPIRFSIGAILCLVRKRSYHGQLMYLPIEDEENVVANGATTEEAVRPTTSISVSDPVPDNWKTIEGNFVIFVALMSGHLGDESVFCADSKTNSGEFRIIYTLDDVTRGQLLAKMGEKTGAEKIANFHEIRTKAFRLVPISPGIISIDGERTEYGPLQVQVHPGMMRLYSRDKIQ